MNSTIYAPRFQKIVQKQRQYLTGVLAEAKKLIAEGDSKEGGFLLLRVHRGLPKNKALIKYLSEEGIKQLLQKTENFYMQDNNREMPKVDAELLFVIDEKNNQIELTDKGIEVIPATIRATSSLCQISVVKLPKSRSLSCQ